ncbi:MAG: ThiF family adenylyltransferase, partial [Pirellulaceae bacterium]|nr:ThiF family adenylyltransferase [Pirellulaceae bacterium]
MEEQPWHVGEEDRYDRLRLIQWWEQKRLAAAHILVVGAGAIGNEVLKNLALIGVGHIYIVDMDNVETSNLSRSVLFSASDEGRGKAVVAAEKVSLLNPEIHVRPFQGPAEETIGLALFEQVDLVIGCLDNRETRLWVNRCCWKVGRPWIDGGIQEINGVVKVFEPPDGACYECTMTQNDYRLLNLRYSCPLLKREDIQSGKVPTAPTIASIVGGLQVQEAIKILHKMPVETGQALVINGLTNQFYKTKFQHKPDCLSHETFSTIDSINLSHNDSLADLQIVLRNFFQSKEGAPSNPKALNGKSSEEFSKTFIPKRAILSLEIDFLLSTNCPTCS